MTALNAETLAGLVGQTVRIKRPGRGPGRVPRDTHTFTGTLLRWHTAPTETSSYRFAVLLDTDGYLALWAGCEIERIPSSPAGAS